VTTGTRLRISRAALMVGATAALLDGILTIIWGRSVVVGALFSCIGLGPVARDILLWTGELTQVRDVSALMQGSKRFLVATVNDNRINGHQAAAGARMY